MELTWDPTRRILALCCSCIDLSMLSPYCQDLGLILIRYVHRVTKTAPSRLNHRLSPFLGINNALKKNIRAKNVLAYIWKEHYVSEIYVAFILQLKHVQHFFLLCTIYFTIMYLFILLFIYFFGGEGYIIGVIGLLLLVLLCIQSKIKIGLFLRRSRLLLESSL